MTALEKFQNSSFEDFMENPSAFGAPTFEEFRKNPDKFRVRDDQILASADAGSTQLSHLVRKHRYFLRDRNGKRVRCNSLEQVEYVAKCEGINLKELQMKPELVQTVEGKYEVHVDFAPKLIVMPEDVL